MLLQKLSLWTYRVFMYGKNQKLWKVRFKVMGQRLRGPCSRMSQPFTKSGWWLNQKEFPCLPRMFRKMIPIWHIISFQWSWFNHQLNIGIKKRVLLCGSSLHLYQKKCDSSLRYLHLVGGFSKQVGFLEDGLPGIVSSDRITPIDF